MWYEHRACGTSVGYGSTSTWRSLRISDCICFASSWYHHTLAQYRASRSDRVGRYHAIRKVNTGHRVASAVVLRFIGDSKLEFSVRRERGFCTIGHARTGHRLSPDRSIRYARTGHRIQSDSTIRYASTGHRTSYAMLVPRVQRCGGRGGSRYCIGLSQGTLRLHTLGQYRTSRSKCVGRYAVSVLGIAWCVGKYATSVPGVPRQVHRKMGSIRYVSTGHRVGRT
eukprot:950607-Rhodomonas_salina.3